LRERSFVAWFVLAMWPFETLVLSRALRAMDQLTARNATPGDILKRLTTGTTIFLNTVPLFHGLSSAPHDDNRIRSGTSTPLHPVAALATVQKFMVGYEMLAMPQRTLLQKTLRSAARSERGPLLAVALARVFL